MPNILRLYRTGTPGRRPGAKTTGEIYVNVADLQFGVQVGSTAQISTPGLPQDLLAVRYFTSTAAYLANDYVIQAGVLYAAKGPIPPGPFNNAQWNTVAIPSSGGAQYLPLSGGTLTGPLLLNADPLPSAPLGAATKQYVDAKVAAVPVLPASTTPPVMNGTASAGAATAYSRGDHAHPTDTTRFPTTGGTITGSLTATGTIAAGSSMSALTTLSLAENGTNANCYVGFFTPANFGTRRGYVGLVNGQIYLTSDQYGFSVSLNSGGITLTAGTTTHTGNVMGTYYGVSGQSNSLNVYGITYSPACAYATANRFSFGWASVTAGYAAITIDQGAVAYSLANASDERMKEDISPSTLDCLATVQKLPLRQFRWKTFPTTTRASEGDGQPEVAVVDAWRLKEARAAKDARIEPVGMIAQEIHTIFPEGVRPGDDFEDHLGMVWDFDRNAMISLLIGAVQQLNARVAELEAKR